MKNLLTYLLLISSLAFLACANDETFTTNASSLLTFSSDTVSMDTVFSTVPTTTKTFWVYNKTDNGLRCRNIKLRNGNQTGFRVNVNGVYLDKTQGFQINDEEIRHGDSIRIFVELTSPLNNHPTPQEISDELIFTLESGAQQKVNLRAWTWDAELLKDVVIDSDSTLSGSKPTVIYGGITVKEGSTLTIPAGKTLYFHDNAGMTVNGRLLCLGAPDNEVILRGDRLDNMFDYLPYDFVSGQWKGITFTTSSYDNELTFTDIHTACDAIVCDSSDIERQKLTVNQSTIHNNKGIGISATNCRITVNSSLISNCMTGSLSVLGGYTDINGCTLAQFYPFDARRGASLFFANSGYADFPIHRLNVCNTIITGYAEDVVMAELKDSIDSNYFFEHCLLRTPEVNDSIRFNGNIWENPKDTTVAGWKNFAKIDTDNLRYDFRLKETSLAIDSASTSSSLPTDRDNIPRDSKPDMGCYEFIKKSEN